MGTALYILLYAFYAALFVWLIYRWKFFNITGVNKKHLAFFFLLKAAAGVALILVFTCYYTDPGKADIYRFFNDSKVISPVLFQNPLAWIKIMTGAGMFEPETFKYLQNTLHFTRPVGDLVTSNAFLIRFISLLNYFSFSNIYVDTLLLDCIVFIGLTVLFKALKPYFVEFHQILYWPVYLMPSFIFWSSGLLKEGLMFVGISFYLSAALKAKEERTPLSIVMLIIGLAIVAMTKIYVAAALVVCSLLLPVKSTGRAARIAWTGRITLFVVLAFVALNSLHGDFCEKIIDKRNEFIALGIAEHSGSNLEIAPVTADCENLVKLLPSGLVNAMLRPFVWDGGNLFQILFAVENTVFVMALSVLLIFYFKKPEGEKLWLAMFCFSFALLNYLGIGLTVPIMGAIVHYRIVALPFLLLGVLLMVDMEKLNTFFATKARRH